MLQKSPPQIATVEPDEWLERSRYWLAEYEASLSKRKRRERPKEPLVLVGHGLNIKVDKGRLVIRDGATHFPSEPREFAFFKGSLELPRRIIILDSSGSISLDALGWLAEQNIPLIRVKWNGTFYSLVSSGGLSADSDKFAWQLKARECDVERLNFYLPILRQKFINSIETLEAFFEPSKPRDTALSQISKYVERLEKEPPDNIKVLLGMEAQSASVYFLTWRTLEIKWSVSKNNPIPDDWRSFYSRGSLKVLNKGNSNIFATHPVNAMLNYAYTVLLGQTQLKVIADGYDPMLGVIHKRSRSQYGPPRPGFAIDTMEPERPVVDRLVLNLIRERTFTGADFDLQSDGVVRVNPELARLVSSRIS